MSEHNTEKPLPMFGRHRRLPIILCVGGAILFFAMFPGVRSGKDTSLFWCGNNLRQIVTALDAYHGEFGSFPPAYTTGADGTPLHSWRTLLLPYLDQTALYARLRLDEPWNSSHNRSVTEQVPGLKVFTCPNDDGRSRRPNETNYLAIVGPDTFWPGSESRRISDVTDEPRQTLILIEVADSSVDFFEPRDLSVDEAILLVSAPDGPVRNSNHSGDINMAFVNGSGLPLFAHETIPPERMRALLTINGGETIDPPY